MELIYNNKILITKETIDLVKQNMEKEEQLNAYKNDMINIEELLKNI